MTKWESMLDPFVILSNICVFEYNFDRFCRVGNIWSTKILEPGNNNFLHGNMHPHANFWSSNAPPGGLTLLHSSS